ncbi:MAG TPA: PLP-dependent aspartate aminotransferase family protein [Candidatus Angelobacter sp.]|jgi:cystathionine gamma-synthase/methionine-gamma-lyase|nr:PLP-dependent aspartate aminotransferase family protein [Candidatus Angelobacter sp.]
MAGDLDEKDLSTRAVHAGERVKAGDFLPMSTPIYSSATFLYDHLADIDAIATGERSGFTYTRHDNPTNAALEQAVASLEGGGVAFSYASGMSAILMSLMAAGIEKGATIVASQDLYGVTVKFLTDVVERWGVRVEFTDVFSREGIERIWALNPKVLLLESMTNPLLRIPDFPALIADAHTRQCRVIVDNTFATPVLLRPLELEADFVVHSATKYLGGHGDLTGGILVTRQEFSEEVRHFSRLVGAILGPFEAWLVLRGLKTLPLRFAHQCQSAQKLAEWLSRHPRIERVYYPGLATHPDVKRCRELFSGGMAGGVVTILIRDAQRADIFRFADSLKLFLKATSLGDVQSLILYPAISSHRDLAPKHRERLGITDNLVRLSVGIEGVSDLQADLANALSEL